MHAINAHGPKNEQKKTVKRDTRLARVRESAAVEDGLRGDAAEGEHGQPAVLDFAQFESRLLVGVGGEVKRVQPEVSCERAREKKKTMSWSGQGGSS